MSKFTFVCQEESMPFVHSVQSKRTVEFNADSLDDILSEFENFLRGCGFYLNGTLDVVNDEEFTEEETEPETGVGSWNWTVNELMKGPVTLQDVSKEDESFVIAGSSDNNLDISNYGAAQPVWPFPSMAGEDTITITGLNQDKCQLCGIQKNVMMAHNCYDDNCPKGSW